MTLSGARAYSVTYREVLEDSKLVDIIYSIKPSYRHRLARVLSRRSQEYWWLIQIIMPINRLPNELLQQILLFTIDDANHSPLVLMLVCRRWHANVTVIWAPLKLQTTTPVDVVTSKLEAKRRFLDVSVDTEFDRGHINPSENAYDAIFAAIEAISRWRTLVVETFPRLPEQVVDHRLPQRSDAVLSQLRTFKIKSACERSPLLDRLLRILGTSASQKLTTIEINSPSVISFLAPTYPSIFNSVKVLSVDAPGLHNPVDLLPHLHQLEEFTACRLSLPHYHSDVILPFVHTLRRAVLKLVSIQWMSGRTFHALESCTITLPLRDHLLHPFSTSLPICVHLEFCGYPLDKLQGFTAPTLDYLYVSCPGKHKLQGTQQLVRFSSQALQESRLAPRSLHISVEAMTWAWIKAFASMSNLKELLIDNAEPSSLGVKVLQSFVVHPAHTAAGWDTPMCPSLKRFGLRYRRWLRSSEHFDLIPEFISIIWSREQSGFPLKGFYIWKSTDQVRPVDLIEGSWISRRGFKWLANDLANNFLQVMASRLTENMFKCSRKSSAVCPQM